MRELTSLQRIALKRGNFKRETRCTQYFIRHMVMSGVHSKEELKLLQTAGLALSKLDCLYEKGNREAGLKPRKTNLKHITII